MTHETILLGTKLKKIEEAKTEEEKETKNSDFRWMEQSMEVVLKAQYETRVQGNYPHLIKADKVLILLTRVKEEEVLEEAWGDFYFFERTINPLGEFTVNLWTGDNLNKALYVPAVITDEISKIPQDYFDKETKTTK